MSVSDQPKYSSDSFVLQTAGNRHVFRTVHLHLSVWRSVGYWHLTICYRPGPLAGYCCVHSALINYEWMRMGEDTWLLVWETVYLYWRQGGPRWGEVRYLSVSVCCRKRLCRGSNILQFLSHLLKDSASGPSYGTVTSGLLQHFWLLPMTPATNLEWRSSSGLKTHQPHSGTSRAWPVLAPGGWNDLPVEIRTAETNFKGRGKINPFRLLLAPPLPTSL